MAMLLIVLVGLLLVVVLVALIAGAIGIGIYNNLVSLRNRFKNAFAQIDVQLKRRHSKQSSPPEIRQRERVIMQPRIPATRMPSKV